MPDVPTRPTGVDCSGAGIGSVSVSVPGASGTPEQETTNMNEYEEMTRPVLDALFESAREQWMASSDALREAERLVLRLTNQVNGTKAQMDAIIEVLDMIDEQNSQPLY